MRSKFKKIIPILMIFFIIGGSILLGILNLIEENKCVNNPPNQKDIETQLINDIFKTNNIKIDSYKQEDTRISYIITIDNIKYMVTYKVVSNYFYGYSWKYDNYKKIEEKK